MTTPTTTLAAIRAQMLTTLEAIVPAHEASIRFERHRGESDFRAWVEMNEQGAWRRFHINSLFDEGPTPASTNSDVEFRSARLELLVAYPKRWGLYGQDGERGAHDVIESDREQIDGRSGIGHNNSAGYVSGQHSSIRVARETLVGDAVLVSRTVYEVTYYRSVSA